MGFALSPDAIMNFNDRDRQYPVGAQFIGAPPMYRPVAAQETARTGVVPDYYIPLTGWTHTLFVIYSILALSALAVYGGAVLSTRLLPHWVGWLAIVYGLAGLGLVGVTGDADPFLHLVLPMVIGILLLLRRYQVPAGSQREEEPIVAPTTAVGEQQQEKSGMVQ